MDIHDEEVKAIIGSTRSHNQGEIKLLKELRETKLAELKEMSDRRRTKATLVKAEVNKDDELVIGKSYRTAPYRTRRPGLPLSEPRLMLSTPLVVPCRAPRSGNPGQAPAGDAGAPV